MTHLKTVRTFNTYQNIFITLKICLFACFSLSLHTLYVVCCCMLYVVCYMLLYVICCMLYVIFYMLYVVCYMLYVVCYHPGMAKRSKPLTYYGNKAVYLESSTLQRDTSCNWSKGSEGA
jgi:hypothetical protein